MRVEAPEMPIENDHLPANHQDAGDVPSQSPPPTFGTTKRPKLPPLMDFYKALSLTLQGFHITRLEWNDENYYGHMVDTWLVLHKPDRKDYLWTISEGDMIAQDWLVLPKRD